jgi:hypothetical protein
MDCNLDVVRGLACLFDLEGNESEVGSENGRASGSDRPD